MQHHRSRAQFDPSEMRMSRYNVHEFGQLDPKDVFQGEELGAGLFVEVADVCRGEEGGRQGLGHGVAQLAPEGAVVVDGGREAGPGGVWRALETGCMYVRKIQTWNSHCESSRSLMAKIGAA